MLEVECSNPLILLQFLEPPGFSKHQPFLYWGLKILFGFIFELDLGRNFPSLSGKKKKSDRDGVVEETLHARSVLLLDLVVVPVTQEAPSPWQVTWIWSSP